MLAKCIHLPTSWNHSSCCALKFSRCQAAAARPSLSQQFLQLCARAEPEPCTDLLPLQQPCSCGIFAVVKWSSCHKWSLVQACCAWRWRKWDKMPYTTWTARGWGGHPVPAEWEPLLNISPSERGIMEIPTGSGSFLNLLSSGSTSLWAQGEVCRQAAAVTCRIPEWSLWAIVDQWYWATFWKRDAQCFLCDSYCLGPGAHNVCILCGSIY